MNALEEDMQNGLYETLEVGAKAILRTTEIDRATFDWAVRAGTDDPTGWEEARENIKRFQAQQDEPREVIAQMPEDLTAATADAKAENKSSGASTTKAKWTRKEGYP